MTPDTPRSGGHAVGAVLREAHILEPLYPSVGVQSGPASLYSRPRGQSESCKIERMTDEEFMLAAISQAERSEPSTNRNPRVGAVLVQEGRAVATAYRSELQ